MSFLRKHYEKIILAGFLLVFILALVYLIMVFSKSTETSEEDLTLIKRKPDYQAKFDALGKETVTDSKKQLFASMQNLNKAKSWIKSENRNPGSPVFTDLTDPIKAARCPKCKKIVPSFYFDKQKDCPLCGCSLKKLKPPDTGGKDNDGDGMPNMYEIQNKLNPENPSDKMEDKDDDGFPNLVEYKAKTKANDAKSHPPIITRLYLEKVTRTKLPLQLFNVMSYGKEDKSKWLIQIKVLGKRGRWKSEFPKLGAILKLRKGLYKIIDVTYKTKEKYDKKLGAPKGTKISEIIIQNTVNKKDKPITVGMKKNVYENLVKITLKDFHTDKQYVVKKGDSFIAGDSGAGMEKYTVLAINKTKSVTVKDEKGKEYTILKKSDLESKIEAIEGEQKEKSKIGDPRRGQLPGRRIPSRRPARFAPPPR